MKKRFITELDEFLETARYMADQAEMTWYYNCFVVESLEEVVFLADDISKDQAGSYWYKMETEFGCIVADNTPTSNNGELSIARNDELHTDYGYAICPVFIHKEWALFMDHRTNRWAVICIPRGIFDLNHCPPFTLTTGFKPALACFIRKIKQKESSLEEASA